MPSVSKQKTIQLLVLIFASVTSSVARAENGAGALFDDAIIARNVVAVRSHAAKMAEADRFQFLLNWVLPSKQHDTIRMAAEFTPERIPIAIDGIESKSNSEIVAPVLDLLELARRLGRLDQVRMRVIEFKPNLDDRFQSRARASLLTLICLQQGSSDKFVDSLQPLQDLIGASVSKNVDDLWPETLVAWEGMKLAPADPAIGDLVNQLFQIRTKHHRRPGYYQWSKLIEMFYAKRNFVASGGSVKSFRANSELKDWISTDRMQAATNQSVSSEGGWIRDSSGELNFHSNRVDDYLLFRSPLQGNFEVEADISPHGHTLLYVAGRLAGPVATQPLLHVGNFQEGVKSEPFARPFSVPHLPWGRARAVFRDDMCSVYLHGRLVQQISISKTRFPWFGFHTAWRTPAKVRNVAITGQPIVPDSVVLSDSKTLDGWLAYHSPSIRSKDASWSWQEAPETSGQIIGTRWNRVVGTWREQLLQYQRPLVEDGSVDYDFFYKPGESIVHPALGRLAFLLKPDGVRTHWVTNSQHERTDITPDNILPEPADSGPTESLALKENDWNHLRLSIARSTVVLHLNQQLIYRRQLIPTGLSSHHRQFGLFHYQGEENVQVRNVVMRGDWPKLVPVLDQQELADTSVAEIEQHVSKLNSVFEHDFSRNGLPESYFKISMNSDGEYKVLPNGIFMGMTASGGWSSQKLNIPFQMTGDFDVEFEFSELQLAGTYSASVLMQIALSGKKQFQPRVARMFNDRQQHAVDASASEERNGKRIYFHGNRSATEMESGRLRLIRLGNTVYTLFAQADSPVFQLVDKQNFTDSPTTTQGVELGLLCNGDSSASVNWKRLRIAAEKLTYYPSKQNGRTLHVLTLPAPGRIQVPDGAVQIRQVTDPVNGLEHVGSAEWSSDGKKVVCDMSMGGVGTSHIMLMNADGTGVKDLGAGAMPSFSPNGKEVVFSRSGIIRMNSDGTNRRSIGSGWGTQWSPDGRYIAWGSGANITLLNTKTGATRMLLKPDQEKQIRSIYWNLGWSRNGKSIAFKARLAKNNSQTVVVADVDSAKEFRIVHSTELRVNEDFSWHPDGRRVLFSMLNPETRTSQMVLVNRDAPDDEPVPIPGIPTDWQVYDCTWSPDGKQILFSAIVPPKPVDWPKR